MGGQQRGQSGRDGWGMNDAAQQQPQQQSNGDGMWNNW